MSVPVGRHVLTAEDRLKAVSPEARAKRRATLARESQLAREDVLLFHQQGFVDYAIAKKMGLAEETVARWLVGKRVRPKYGRGWIERKA